MKTKATGWVVALFALQVWFPLLCLLTGFTDYYLVLHHAWVTALAVTLPTVAITLILVLGRDWYFTPFADALLALSLFLAMVGGFILFVKSGDVFAGFTMFLNAVGVFVLVARLLQPLAFKVVTMVLSSLLALPFGFFSFLLLMFSLMEPARTTIEEIPSPNGTYCAAVIDSDQGALGGDTLVTVSKTAGTVDLYFFTFETASKTVYVGEWLEYERMNIYWENDEVLVIHGKEYPVT